VEADNHVQVWSVVDSIQAILHLRGWTLSVGADSYREHQLTSRDIRNLVSIAEELW
jgi:hypothetical protein